MTHMGEVLENTSSNTSTTTPTTEPSLPRLKFPFLLLNSALNSTGMDSSSSSSPEHPLQTRASVPFKWEEQPGKPRPCTDIIVRPEPVRLCLELPPSRKYEQYSSSASSSLSAATDYSLSGGSFVNNDDSKTTKTPSPTAVLDGPYNVGRPKFSSFRLFMRESSSTTTATTQDHESSGSSASPESINYLEGFVGTSKKMKKNRVRGIFGKFNRKGSGAGGGGKKEAMDVGGSFGFSSSSRFSPFSTTSSCYESDRESVLARSMNADAVDGGGKMKRNGSFSSAGLSSHGGGNNSQRSQSSSSHHFLASIYEGFKQVIHWSGSRKSSKESQV